MTMQIKNKKIGGFSAVKVRNALRHIGDTECFDANGIFVEYLHVEDGQPITKAILELGYIEPTTPKFTWLEEEKVMQWYALTENGASFARASGMTRIPRIKAEDVVNGVLKRIAEANAGPYAFSIVKAVVFGSFVREHEQSLGDVDIAIELASRYADQKERDRAEEERRRIAEKDGRRFSNIVLRLYWPQEEVFKQPKSGSALPQSALNS